MVIDLDKALHQLARTAETVALMPGNASTILPFVPRPSVLRTAVATLSREFPSWRLTIYADEFGVEIVVAAHPPSDCIFVAKWTKSGWRVFTRFGAGISRSPSLVRALREAMS